GIFRRRRDFHPRAADRSEPEEPGARPRGRRESAGRGMLRGGGGGYDSARPLRQREKAVAPRQSPGREGGIAFPANGPLWINRFRAVMLYLVNHCLAPNVLEWQ